MASMAPFCFGGDPGLHLLEGLGASGIGERSEDVLRMRGREERRSFQENAIRGVLYDKARAGITAALLPDGFRQYDLPLCRYGRRELFGICHALHHGKTKVRY